MTGADWDALTPVEKALSVLHELRRYADQNHWGIHSDMRGWLDGHAEAAIQALKEEQGNFEAIGVKEYDWPGLGGKARIEYRQYPGLLRKNGYYGVAQPYDGVERSFGPFIAHHQASMHVKDELYKLSETRAGR